MTDIDVSVGLAPTFESAELIATAEKLGYRRAYLFDTPFEGDDVWLGLHRAAEVTSTIELGPGVLIPTQRHPLVNAAQTVSLNRIAPGRTFAAFGTGFSSRAAIGQPPIRWAYMEDYIRTYQKLLAGEIVDWEGSAIKLMLTSEQADALPLRIPLLVSAIGPKGAAAAQRLGADGIISLFQVLPDQRNFRRAIVAVFGTVLDEHEDPADERVRLAVGPAWAGMFHFVYTGQGAAAVADMPGGAAWLEVIESIPERERHLHIHQGHMAEMNKADMAAWNAGGHVSMTATTLTGPPEVVGSAVAAMAQEGATEVMIQPIGPDIGRELEAFITAVRNS